VIRSLKINTRRMAAALDAATLATDLADYLVRKGVPFRQSHHLVGEAVRRADALGVSLQELDLAEYQNIHPDFAPDVYACFDPRASVEARDAIGGTSPAAVQAQIEQARALLDQIQTN
jgi:argininosuccinate lyase